MDILVLLAFVAILVGCIIADVSIVIALLLGYALFVLYSFRRGFAVKNVLQMSFEGLWSARNILITFMLIGILTALWRASGTIPTIVAYSMKFVKAEIFIVLTFLLCSLVSFLTGTAFGTAATMGCICMTVGKAMGADVLVTGGAILSGSFFGDRCSPVSTSALLVSELTKTNLYKNIKNMMKTALVPLAVSVAIFTVLGFVTAGNASGALPDVSGLFGATFRLEAVTLLPAAVILIMSLARLNVKITMTASIVVAALICVLVQDVPISQLFPISVFGYETANTEIASMINGGGIVSMLRAAAIVSISSCYSGIFRKTGLLESVGRVISKIGEKLSPFAAVVITSIISSCIACNQTLAIMLTNQLCSHLEGDKERFAIYLENSAVVIAPLIPWSIAGNVPLTSSGSPALSVVTAFYLYLVPLWSFIIFKKSKSRFKE
ncbi:MAG: sodium:proton antiporter [Clostridia bacterium]|nr:sodium:proton antiporter [Clostridia bacterium]